LITVHFVTITVKMFAYKLVVWVSFSFDRRLPKIVKWFLLIFFDQHPANSCAEGNEIVTRLNVSENIILTQSWRYKILAVINAYKTA